MMYIVLYFGDDEYGGHYTDCWFDNIELAIAFATAAQKLGTYRYTSSIYEYGDNNDNA